jgi:hypothetical protein
MFPEVQRFSTQWLQLWPVRQVYMTNGRFGVIGRQKGLGQQQLDLKTGYPPHTLSATQFNPCH